VGELGPAVRLDRRRDEAVDGDAEGDVEAADERGRRQLEGGARQPPPTLLAGALVDLLRLGSGHYSFGRTCSE
jgi:hypothetical protein